MMHLFIHQLSLLLAITAHLYNSILTKVYYPTYTDIKIAYSKGISDQCSLGLLASLFSQWYSYYYQLLLYIIPLLNSVMALLFELNYLLIYSLHINHTHFVSFLNKSSTKQNLSFWILQKFLLFIKNPLLWAICCNID